MIPDNYGPTNQDEECLTWLYYSSVDAERDVYSGLAGPLLVCRAGTLDENGKQVSVSHKAHDDTTACEFSNIMYEPEEEHDNEAKRQNLIGLVLFEYL